MNRVFPALIDLLDGVHLGSQCDSNRLVAQPCRLSIDLSSSVVDGFKNQFSISAAFICQHVRWKGIQAADFLAGSAHSFQEL